MSTIASRQLAKPPVRASRRRLHGVAEGHWEKSLPVAWRLGKSEQTKRSLNARITEAPGIECQLPGSPNANVCALASVVLASSLEVKS